MVLTVFSAPNYVGTHDNLGAFLHFTSESNIEVIQYDIERAIRFDLLPNPKGERFSYPHTDTSHSITETAESGISPTIPSESKPKPRSLPLPRDRCQTAPASGSKMRKQSLTLMQQGTIGELGSEKFRHALSMGMESEKHPGWNTIRRATLAIGQFQAARRSREARDRISLSRIDAELIINKQDQIRSSQASEKSPPIKPLTLPSPDPEMLENIPEPEENDLEEYNRVFIRAKSEPTPLVFSQVKRSSITTEDSEQIKIMFDSIDKDRDGKISNSDLTDFLFNIEEYSLTQGEELFHQIDSNSDGVVNFEEFCTYITNLELLPEEHLNSTGVDT